MAIQDQLISKFEDLRRNDVASVGGKNASLGELISTLDAKGIAVPPGFATTAAAYWSYLDRNALREQILERIEEWQTGKASLSETGKAIRYQFLHGDWPAETASAILSAYLALCIRIGSENAAVAVRSSATAEDLPDASFAGQQETFLNISGAEALLNACRRCYASLFTDPGHKLSPDQRVRPYQGSVVYRCSADGPL